MQSPFGVTGLFPRHGASLDRTPRFTEVLTVGRFGLLSRTTYVGRTPRARQPDQRGRAHDKPYPQGAPTHAPDCRIRHDPRCCVRGRQCGRVRRYLVVPVPVVRAVRTGLRALHCAVRCGDCCHQSGHRGHSITFPERAGRCGRALPVRCRSPTPLRGERAFPGRGASDRR